MPLPTRKVKCYYCKNSRIGFGVSIGEDCNCLKSYEKRNPYTNVIIEDMEYYKKSELNSDGNCLMYKPVKGIIKLSRWMNEDR